MTVNRKSAAVGIVIALALALVFVFVALPAMKKRGKKATKAVPRRAPGPARSAPSPRRVGAASANGNGMNGNGMNGNGMNSPPAAAPFANGPHPDYLINGSTANSQTPMPAAHEVEAMLTAASSNGEGPQTDVRLHTRAAMNLSDGSGIQLPAEVLAGIKSNADLEQVFRSDPKLAAEYERILANMSTQRGDASGIKRSKVTREEAQALLQSTSGLPVTHQGAFGGNGNNANRSGAAPSASTMERFASAVGESNMANLSASREQYDNLISRTLVAPQDEMRQAALIAMIHKVTDPGQRAKLMAKVGSLSAATFRDSASAQKALQDGSTGYIGFTELRPARGSIASLGARYGAGDGGDLMPVVMNYPTMHNVNKDRVQGCGAVSAQAYEVAVGR